MAMTKKRIAKAKTAGRYGDGHGLSLQVTASGVKSWLFRYERNGRERWMGLGPLHTVSLAEARERARKARLQLLDGTDPLAARKAARAAQALEAAKTLTFAECAQRYFDQHESKWRNAKHAKQYMATLKTYAFPVMGRLPVAEIDTGRVLAAIEPIWKTKPETASRTRGRIESVLDWATVRGYRTGDNPARWKGHLREVLPALSQIAKPQHFAALPFTDVPEFVAALREREGIAARALEFLILTAGRSGEVIGATWPEIDLKNKLWTIPADRMKAQREHRVPLSDAAMAVLKDLPREADYVFPGSRKGGPISSTAMAQLLARMESSDCTIHGFRSSFHDWCSERTNFPNQVIEMALAHQIGDKVEAAYRRGDLLEKRRRLMQDWARYCATKPVEAGNKVVSLRRPV